MRSITFISAMLAATVAQAEIPLGCFERNYDAKHIAEHPAQIVDYVKLWVYTDTEYDQINATIEARFIDQGRIKGRKVAGQTLDQILTCFQFSEGPGCAVDCDGGSFVFVQQEGQSVTIETSNLSMGPAEECGGSESLAEVFSEPVRYKLNRAADANCEGMGWE